ncbi:MAG: prepilin peptidase [Rubrobacteraceae bacterium]|nr:prepilin peptidase [Rubrobacteraceae bacterium]
MLVLVAVLFGLVVGSFLNVVIHRVPQRESVVWPASHCPHCGEPIRPGDNVPLVSYVLLRGRCRNCKEPISARYPAVEATTGLLFGAAAYEFGASLALLPALVLASALISLAVIDLEHRLLPNVIVGPAALAGLVLSILADPAGWWMYPLSAVAVAGFLFGLVLIYPSGMGMGDVKMGGMLGAFLGPYAALAVFLGALLGAVSGGLLMAAGKVQRRSALPFGLFMALGGVISLFVGPQLWELYMNLMWR